MNISTTGDIPGKGAGRFQACTFQLGAQKIYHKNAERLFEQFKGVKGTSTSAHFSGTAAPSARASEAP